MEDEWFYGEGQTQRGPVTKAQLLTALRAMPQPYRVYVWRDGMGDWQHAGDVPEVSAALPIDIATTKLPIPPLPPPVPEAPRPQEPQFATSFAPSPVVFAPSPVAATSEAKEVARLFGRLVKLIALQIGLSIAFTIFVTQMPSAYLRPVIEPLAILISIAKTLADIGIVILLVVTAYRLMKRMHATAPALWGLSMLIPYFNIVMLIVINSMAQTFCRERGIKVGLFGPKLERVA